MTRGLRAAAAALLLLGAACAPPRTAPAPRSRETALRASLDSIFSDTAFAHAHWGVHVRSLRRGDTLYQRDGDKLFVPASNMKLLTGAAALAVLGPDFRYRTELLAAGPLRGGVLRGDLVVRGSGDPTISVRFAPDPRAVFRAWADSLRARGVVRIAGRIVGDDDVFDELPLGRGWAWDDLDAAYSAEISGLPFNEGALAVRAVADPTAAAGVRVALDPPTGYVAVVPRLRIAAGERPSLQLIRAPTGTAVELRGALSPTDSAVTERVAVRNPTLFFATVLRETLREAGIVVEGAAVDVDDLPLAQRGAAGALLFAHRSPSLAEILPAYLKPSQNQIAEILLRTVGREARGTGSAVAGAATIDSLLAAWRVEPRRAVIADGSGLSRYDLVSPELLAGVLAHMAASPDSALWRRSLPVAGVDGTLAGRLRGTPAEGRIQAKTGTLSGVRALSGYLVTADGEPLVFSILVNHHTLAARDADRVIDAALLRLVGWSRSGNR